MTPRSLLFVPADQPAKISKAVAAGADAVILDLEDSVAPARKAAAREQAAAALSARSDDGPQLWVRINPLNGPHALHDLVAVVATRPHAVVLPKAEGAASVRQLGHYLDALEAAAGFEAGAIQILPIATETPGAVLNLSSYAHAPARLAGLTWGAEDLPAALGAATAREPGGGYTAPYELARSLCLFAAGAARTPAIETIYPDYRDLDGLTAYASRACRDGFSGMMAIHPAQIEAIHRSFAPTDEQVAQARRIVALFAAAPQGALGLDGRMLDAPHLRQAQAILDRAARPSPK